MNIRQLLAVGGLLLACLSLLALTSLPLLTIAVILLGLAIVL